MIGPGFVECEGRVPREGGGVVPLYRLASSQLEPVPETTFEREELTERSDLQRMLRDHPEVLGDDQLIVLRCGQPLSVGTLSNPRLTSLLPQ